MAVFVFLEVREGDRQDWTRLSNQRTADCN